MGLPLTKLDNAGVYSNACSCPYGIITYFSARSSSPTPGIENEHLKTRMNVRDLGDLSPMDPVMSWWNISYTRNFHVFYLESIGRLAMEVLRSFGRFSDV